MSETAARIFVALLLLGTVLSLAAEVQTVPAAPASTRSGQQFRPQILQRDAVRLLTLADSFTVYRVAVLLY